MIKPATNAWLHTLHNILQNGKRVEPRGKMCFEILNWTTEVDMSYPVVRNKGRNLGYKFMPAEAYWILTGDSKVETIAPFSKTIANYSDDGKVFFGAYGPKVIGQLPYIIDSLSRDKDTRQAVLTIWRENPPQTKDYPCTVALQFIIRDSMLHAIATMRSSDVWMGLPYDIFNFTMISAMVVLMLYSNKQRLYSLGNLYVNCGSQHIYEDNVRSAFGCFENMHMGEEFYFNPYRITQITSDFRDLLSWLDEMRSTGDLKTIIEV